MLNVIWQFVRDEEGASAAEYALLLIWGLLMLPFRARSPLQRV
jgi:Flp pilus assembly pilin Flp